MKKQSVSVETQQEALKLAKHNQKPGQSKEQTKLIAQGIQKGIEQYKKAQKAKAREANKYKKRQQKIKASNALDQQNETVVTESKIQALPWILLALSWLGFGAYLFAG